MQSNKIELIKQIIIIALIIIVPFITIKTIYFIESSSDKRDAKLINLSTLTGDSNLCFKIKNKELKNQCFFEIAKRDRNILLCENLVDIKQQGRYPIFDVMPIVGYNRRESTTHNNRDNCVQEIRKILIEDAVKSSNYSICKDDEECLYQLTILLNNSNNCYKFSIEKKNTCFLEISKNKQDIRLCDGINESNLKKECYYYFSGFIHEEKICTMIPEDKTAECYYNLAINKSNIDYCNKAGTKEGECFFNIAKEINTPAYCIKAGEFDSQCWNFFALNHSEEEFCRVSSDSGNCYYSLALQMNKSELCKEAKEKEDICFYRFAMANQDPALCLELESMAEVCPNEIIDYKQMVACRVFDNAVSSCIYLASTSTSAYCDYISKDYYKHKCYRNVAIANSDADMCNLAEDFTNNCYFEIAIKEKRIDLCNKAGSWRSECFEKLSNITSD